MHDVETWILMEARVKVGLDRLSSSLVPDYLTTMVND